MIRVSQLVFEYRRGGDLVLDGVNQTFESGAVSVVTGPSGCGKSTLLYLAGLLLEPKSGQILVDDLDVTGWSDIDRSRLRAESIGFVFQDAALDPTRTVLDNVVEGGLYAGMSRRDSVKEAQRLLSRLGVELRSEHRPGEVSGGQAQRVGLCRALIKKPSIILADEPTGNLDPASADIVFAALTDAAADGATVVIATHELVVASRADHVLSF